MAQAAASSIPIPPTNTQQQGWIRNFNLAQRTLQMMIGDFNDPSSPMPVVPYMVRGTKNYNDPQEVANIKNVWGNLPDAFSGQMRRYLNERDILLEKTIQRDRLKQELDATGDLQKKGVSSSGAGKRFNRFFICNA